MSERVLYPDMECWKMRDGFWVRGLVVGPLATNCYLLSRGDEALIIDPGADSEAIIAMAGASESRVKYILATHAHFDHVGAMKVLQEALGGECLLHAGDLPLLESLSAQAACFGMQVGLPPRIDRFVEDGDTLSLGGNVQGLKILHTPGHSPGGISILGPGFIFVGDTLFSGSIGRTDLPGGSYPMLMNSIARKILVLGDEVVVFAGHGEITSVGRERRNNPYLSGAVER
jgi:glyoxylase-like metal-dependent hydrolase (beta-lactamase superfamily II)